MTTRRTTTRNTTTRNTTTRDTTTRNTTAAATTAAVAGAAIVAVGFGPHGGVLAGLVATVVAVARRGVRRARARARADQARTTSEDLLAAFADELDAGRAPTQALRNAVAGVLDDRQRRDRERQVDPGDVAAALRLPVALDHVPALLAAGAEPAAVLRACQAPALRQLGVGWQVSHRTGIRLAPVASKLAATVRADAERRRELRTSLAGARSSARLLAGLPLAGPLLGGLVGASPHDVLLGTKLGLVCLVVGVLLDLVGLGWTNRIADAAVRARAEPFRLPGQGGRRAAVPDSTTQLAADLPIALDLTAACLAAGTAPDLAQRAVGQAVGQPLGPAMLTAARLVSLGTPVTAAFANLLPVGRPLRLGGFGRDRAGPARAAVLAVARALERSGDSGARVATTLERVADRLRADAHADTLEAVRRAGVLAVLPLGLCFLPAFGLLGVVPVVLATADGLLGEVLPAVA